MTPKTELIGRIEDYCLDLMDAQQKLEFEKELEFSQELREEVELHKNLQAAVLEIDVLNLKEKLQDIQDAKSETSQNGSFELLDELEDIQELTDDLTFEELLDSFESLPKVHVYQHEKTDNENIHHFYKEQSQNGSEVNGFEEELNGFDFEDMEGLEEAALETDIMNLRETLQHVAKTVEPQYSVEQIDEYLNGEMSDSILAEFEAEIKQNKQLKDEVNLHLELDSALEEFDIMQLRNEIGSIMEAETSWNVSESTIEDFIDGILSEDMLEEFGTELKENTDLMAEVTLREKINSAIGEKDIMYLRNQLGEARRGAEKQEVKSIVMPKFDLQSTRFWRNSVAMIIVLIGLAGILNTGMQSTERSYNKYFDTPTWASERSVNSNVDIIQTAKIYFQQSDYAKVINELDKVTPQKDEAFVVQFYKGLSYQNLNKFDKAINEYEKVVEHGNNLFVEEAEWYQALCYLKENKRREARTELLAVIDRKGHYEKDAKAILRKLRYTFK
ncbi:MAG: tetratricopeptide repeat protein [Draconibacterium sp.]